MGKLPKQVMEADAEAEAALAEIGGTKEAQGSSVSYVPQQQQEESVAEEIPHTIPLDDGIMPDNSKEIQRYKSAMGRAKKIEEEAAQREAAVNARASEMEERIAKLEAENARLTEENDRFATSMAKYDYVNAEDEELENVMNIMNEGLDDDDAMYSREEARKFLRSVNAVSEVKLKGIKDELNAYRVDANTKRLNSFIAEIERQFPGWEKLDRGKDPRWLNFLSQSSPYDNGTYGDKAREALDRCDMEKLSNIIRSFSQATGVKFSQNGSSQVGADQVRPDGRFATPSIHGSKNFNMKTIPRSLAENFKRAYQSKKWRNYGMTDEQAKKFITQIENAEAYGMIDEKK